MKKTVNANIGGFPFVVDEDAFKALRRYLNEIDVRLDGDENREVLEDIESRVADIFKENISPRVQVVDIDLVRRAISIIGPAEEFGEPHRSTAGRTGLYDEPERGPQIPPASKKLYRSRTSVVLGGVCGGLADYLNMDVTLVRIIYLILILFGGTGVLLYIILWIVIPREPLAVAESNNNKEYNRRR